MEVHAFLLAACPGQVPAVADLVITVVAVDAEASFAFRYETVRDGSDPDIDVILGPALQLCGSLLLAEAVERLTQLEVRLLLEDLSAIDYTLL